MKNKNVFTIVFEGTDGVGKSTIQDLVRRRLGFIFMCQHRGDISSKVYSEIYNRAWTSCERGLPMLYIYLRCNKDILKERVIERAAKQSLSNEELVSDLKKVEQQDVFDRVVENFKNDYNIITVDTSYMDEEMTYEIVRRAIVDFLKRRQSDETMTTWNKMYDDCCKKLGLRFKVVDNQPWINEVPVMVESTCHNGVYEMYADKRWPDNLMYAYAYTFDNLELADKEYDFQYIINSKINNRPEIWNYYDAINNAGRTCLVSSSIKQYDFPKLPRTFGKDFIKEISKAKATIYCSRDLAYLELQTARLYEAILARNIVFVDKLTDPSSKILTAIHDDTDLVELLTVDPSNVVDKFQEITSNSTLIRLIIHNQNKWLKEQFSKLTDPTFNKFIGGLEHV